ncbi:MAG: type II toxin-antitoxin system Phd/YefM family antitoxin [Oscillospiraceae bacterium]|nr:type II toxin-antitoxin system Phd/YefM family antitoxin [Oscillospiraceae bacterium]
MNTIIPASDLKDNLDDILMTVHASSEPIFLTRNGYGDMVLMSMEAYDKMRFDIEVYSKLSEALHNEEQNHKYFTVDEAWEAMTKVKKLSRLPM